MLISLQLVCFLTHCGLMTSYGNIDLGLDWLRLWHATWLHQAISWNNYDGSSTGSSGIHSRVMFTWASALNYVWNVYIWNYTTSHREESACPMKLVKTAMIITHTASCNNCMLFWGSIEDEKTNSSGNPLENNSSKYIKTPTCNYSLLCLSMSYM